MAEIMEIIGEKVMHAFYVCLIIAAVILLADVAWRLTAYLLKRNRIEAAKQIYNAIRLDEPKEKALQLFYSYAGSAEQYTEETMLTNGKREIVLCLLFIFGGGEAGEIRLTYIDDRLVQKRQNGIW